MGILARMSSIVDVFTLSVAYLSYWITYRIKHLFEPKGKLELKGKMANLCIMARMSSVVDILTASVAYFVNGEPIGLDMFLSRKVSLN